MVKAGNPDLMTSISIEPTKVVQMHVRLLGYFLFIVASYYFCENGSSCFDEQKIALKVSKTVKDPWDCCFTELIVLGYHLGH